MLLFVGWIIVSAALLGGFIFSGGNPGTLFVTGEYIIIIGFFSATSSPPRARRS